MDRQRPIRPRELSLDELEDAQDLRSVIAAALARTPVDAESLRHGVWTYVTTERDLGTSAGLVIVALTELVDASTMQTALVRQSMMRQVILWCVEAYFGYLGGGVVGGSDGARAGASVGAPPMVVSNP